MAASLAAIWLAGAVVVAIGFAGAAGMAAEVIRAGFAVKARNRRRGGVFARLPVVWVFSDAARLPDPCAVIARLPPGLCGVVLRDPPSAGFAERVARACRARRVALVIAGNRRLAARLGVGAHLRATDNDRVYAAGKGLCTASAHNLAELRRAKRAGVHLVFLSPLWPTQSHPGAPALGPRGWVALARRSRVPVAALGGIGADRGLPRAACGLAAISPFAGLASVQPV